VLAFEFRELGFEVLDVFFFAFAKGALGGAVLGSTADAHVGDYFFVLSRVWAPPSAVFQLWAGEVGEFDWVDDLRLRFDVLGVGCGAGVGGLVVVEAGVRLERTL